MSLTQFINYGLNFALIYIPSMGYKSKQNMALRQIHDTDKQLMFKKEWKYYWEGNKQFVFLPLPLILRNQY